VLRSDADRSNAAPSDYDTDLESDWSNPSKSCIRTTSLFVIAVHADLFAEGGDFSEATIERNRNLFNQKQTAHTLTKQMNDLINRLTQSLQIHLNVAQSFVVNSSSTILALETVSSLVALANKQIHLTGSVRLSMPSQLSLVGSGASASARYSIRVSDRQERLDPLSP
jgi:hypothetical protein